MQELGMQLMENTTLNPFAAAARNAVALIDPNILIGYGQLIHDSQVNHSVVSHLLAGRHRDTHQTIGKAIRALEESLSLPSPKTKAA